MLRAKIEVGLAFVAGALAVITLVWPTWIESTFGAEPDGGSGGAEWLLAAAFAGAALVLGILGVRHHRTAIGPEMQGS
jgi:hypothetical protein